MLRSAPDQPITKLTIATLLCLLLGLFFLTPLQADTGQVIYQQGITESGIAIIGNRQSQAPATLFPCINCHGERAAGSKESGVSAPNITWNQLTQAYRKGLDGGQPRAAYTAISFKELLLKGRDSDGKSLSGSMPRYTLNDNEVNALIEYLKHIDQQNARGVSSDTINFWLRLPENPELAEAMSATVNAFINQLNSQGGIYRRQLRLVDFSPAEAEQSTFGIIDLRLLEQQSLDSDHITLGIFQARDAGENAYFLYPHPNSLETMRQAVATQRGWTMINADQNEFDQLLEQRAPTDDRFMVLNHSNESIPIEQLLGKLQQSEHYPGILTDSLSLTATKRVAIENYPAPVYLLAPPGPESVSVAGQAYYLQLARQPDWQAGLSGEHLQARLWCLSLMKLLVTALEQSGKDLTEQIFAETLQSQVDLHTDFGPKLSYSATRRVGNSDPVLIPLN